MFNVFVKAHLPKIGILRETQVGQTHISMLNFIGQCSAIRCTVLTCRYWTLGKIHSSILLSKQNRTEHRKQHKMKCYNFSLIVMILCEIREINNLIFNLIIFVLDKVTQIVSSCVEKTLFRWCMSYDDMSSFVSSKGKLIVILNAQTYIIYLITCKKHKKKNHAEQMSFLLLK